MGGRGSRDAGGLGEPGLWGSRSGAGGRPAGLLCPQRPGLGGHNPVLRWGGRQGCFWADPVPLPCFPYSEPVPCLPPASQWRCHLSLQEPGSCGLLCGDGPHSLQGRPERPHQGPRVSSGADLNVEDRLVLSEAGGRREDPAGGRISREKPGGCGRHSGGCASSHMALRGHCEGEAPSM